MATSTAALLLPAGVAGASGNSNAGGDDKLADVAADWTCDGVTAHSTKDLSNVVVSIDGEHIKHDGLSGYSFEVEGDIDAIWIKSGLYLPDPDGPAPEGPGQGELVELGTDPVERNGDGGSD